jgi:1-acyl-sn-glycerol-3-phosphate acyltransferase
MQDQPSVPPKPVTEVWRPDLIVLPRLTLARRLFRWWFLSFIKFVRWIIMRAAVRGLENLPKKGPALVVFNHIGDLDGFLVGSVMSFPPDAIVKIETRDERWLVSRIIRAYGFIYIHRGLPDRRALRAVLDGLAEGRVVILAPEGRQTLTGGLEAGTDGATFLALKSGAPIVPIAILGTQNPIMFGNLKKWKRTEVTVTVGKPFFVKEQPERRDSLPAGTRQIMEALARLLPPEKRGVYSYVAESTAPE